MQSIVVVQTMSIAAWHLKSWLKYRNRFTSSRNINVGFKARKIYTRNARLGLGNTTLRATTTIPKYGNVENFVEFLLTLAFKG